MALSMHVVEDSHVLQFTPWMSIHIYCMYIARFRNMVNLIIPFCDYHLTCAIPCDPLTSEVSAVKSKLIC